jgi:hypothetical protein
MEYLIKASIVLAIFYICYYIFLRKETFFNQNRWFLLSGLIIASIFPLVVIPVHVTIEPQVVSQPLLTYASTTPIVEGQQT